MPHHLSVLEDYNKPYNNAYTRTTYLLKLFLLKVDYNEMVKYSIVESLIRAFSSSYYTYY